MVFQIRQEISHTPKALGHAVILWINRNPTISSTS